MCRLMDSGAKAFANSSTSTSTLQASGGDHMDPLLESMLHNVARESFNVLLNLCHLLNTADAFKVATILNTHDKVLSVLTHMECVTNFQEFVQSFGEFGSNMVELAQLSGERQNDLLSDCCSSKLSCSRAVLEKGTMMLLTASKTLLRHPECNSAQKTRDSVYDLIKTSLTTFRVSLRGLCGATGQHARKENEVASSASGSGGAVMNEHDGKCCQDQSLSIQQLLNEIQGLTCDSVVTESISQWTFNKLNHLVSVARGEFELLLTTSANNGLLTSTTAVTSSGAMGVIQQRPGALLSVPEEEKNHIFTALDQIHITCQSFAAANASPHNTSSPGAGVMEFSLQKFALSFSAHVDNFIKSLHSTVLNQSALCLTSQNEIVQSLHLFRQAASGNLVTTQSDQNGQQMPAHGMSVDNISAVENESAKFQMHADQYQNLCRLLYHVCDSTKLRVSIENCQSCIRFFSHQLILSAQTAALYPSSKIANENLTVFIDVWNSQMHSFSTLMNDIVGIITNRTEKQPNELFRTMGSVSYLNITRTRRLGLEIKRVASLLENEVDLLHSSLDAEGVLSSPQLSSDKSSCSDIMKRCGNLCSMAFALYLFSKKEGPLKSADDLYTQVQFFVEEGSKIHSLINEKSQQLISLAMGGQIQLSTVNPVAPQQSMDAASDLKRLFAAVPEKTNSLLYIVTNSEPQNAVSSFYKVEMCFQETNVVMWNIFALVRYYFQAMYLTYLPDYNWPINASVSQQVPTHLAFQVANQQPQQQNSLQQQPAMSYNIPPLQTHQLQPIFQQIQPFQQFQSQHLLSSNNFGNHASVCVRNPTPNNLMAASISVDPQFNAGQHAINAMNASPATVGATVQQQNIIQLPVTTYFNQQQQQSQLTQQQTIPQNVANVQQQQQQQFIAPISAPVSSTTALNQAQPAAFAPAAQPPAMNTSGMDTLKKTSSLFDRM